MNNPVNTETMLAGAVWRKSARSSPSGDNCVEVAFVPGGVAVRDSKNRDGSSLLFTEEEWNAFVAGAKEGEFDLH
jgi:hypothetical protein